MTRGQSSGLGKGFDTRCYALEQTVTQGAQTSPLILDFDAYSFRMQHERVMRMTSDFCRQISDFEKRDLVSAAVASGDN